MGVLVTVGLYTGIKIRIHGAMVTRLHIMVGYESIIPYKVDGWIGSLSHSPLVAT